VKGDLSGLSQPGTATPKLTERITQLKLEAFEPEACPVVFWDVYGKQGHLVRTVGSQIGRQIVRGVLGSLLGGRR